MPLSRFCFALVLFIYAFQAQQSHAQISKGNQILIDRGFQLQGLATPGDVFHLSTFSNANYTSINWLWDSNPSLHGPVPGFPWSRWVRNQGEMPPLGSEGAYTSQLLALQLGDEQFLTNDTVRDAMVNWFTNVQSSWPNTILYINNYAGQAPDAALGDFISRAHPDMICFDNYPFEADQNTGAHYALWTSWFSEMRRYREHAKNNNIPFATYRQTFHAEERPIRVYRDPSRSELRYNTFGALAFNAKMLVDFTYNTGASSLFTNAFGGDNAPTILYTEMSDANLRARNFGKALVRLKPISDAVPNSYTTGSMFIRGKNSGGTPNPIPIGFLAAPQDPDNYTLWQTDNDPYLNSWAVTNKGTKNSGQPGDVIVSWFKPLDESFDGTGYTNEVYLMVVNGLTDPTGTPADCLQEIKLNFAETLLAVEMLNPLTGLVQVQSLPLTNGLRQLVLNLNGGDAVLFKFADGAPFVGAQVVGPPVIAKLPVGRTNVVGTDATFSVTAAGASPFGYQWRANGVNINGATTSSYTQTNVQPSDDFKSYTVMIANASGSVTSAPATLTVVSSLPPFFYEPFDYPNIGQPVSSNTPANWTFGGSGTNDLNVASENLSYPGLMVPTGNSVTNGGAGLGVRRLFGTSVNSGILYFSALFRINNLGFGAWNGLSSQVGALTAPDNSTFRLAVMVRSNSPSGYVFGVQKGGPGTTTTFDTNEFHANDTVFLVGKYDFTTVSNTVSLWINPDSSAFGSGSPPLSFISANTGTNGLTIDRFNLRQNVAMGANSVPAAMQWDELRVGRTWAEVTPVQITFTEFERLNDGRFQLAYTSSTGRNGSIYASTNLTNWISIGAATQIAPGLYQFTDTAATNYPRRFYQLRSP